MKIIDVLTSPWAIKPDRLVEISEIYSRHLRGEKISRDTISLIEAQIGKPLETKPQGYDVISGVAIVPLQGVIAKRMNLFTKISGGVSSELFIRDFNAALNDPLVKAIVLNVDSPGGTVDGTQEAAATVFSARNKKPCISFCNGMMASAAYWIGSSAEGIYISGDTVDVGSIGVVTTHTDYSKAEDMAGIKTTEITAGKYKRIASEYGPLTESGRAYIQEQLDHIYEVFLSDVGKNRGGLSADQVHERMADGRIFIGKKAISAGLVDGVSTLDELINILASGGMPEKSGKSITVEDRKTEPEAQSVAGDVAADNESKKEEIMDVKELKEKHADLYQSVFDEGKKAGLEEGLRTGAAGEIERVRSVKAVSMPGHEALIESLMFDGKTTGPEAAVKVIEAENSKRVAKAGDIKKDGEDIQVPVAEAPLVESEKKKPAGEQLSELAKKKMEQDKSLSYSAALTAVQIEHPELAKEYAASRS